MWNSPARLPALRSAFRLYRAWLMFYSALLLCFCAGSAYAAGWSSVASLNTPRQYHTSTLLPNGKVLIAGGSGANGYLASAEIYDPATNSWASAGSLSAARYGHTATLLTNGQVLVVGGQNNTGYLTSAELYDPASNSWRVAAALTTARYNHAATLLPNGNVIITGGFGSAGYIAGSELYAPPANGTDSGSWTDGGQLVAARYGHTVTLLPGGILMVIGGRGVSGNTLNSVETCDLSVIPCSWATAAGTLTTARYGHTATYIPASNRILVAGGQGATVLSSAELVNPASGTGTATGSLTTARVGHSATLLANGTVLTSGGFDGASFLSSYEIYSAATWSSPGSMTAAHSAHTATLLANGYILAVGGYNGAANLARVEIYDPTVAGSFAATGSMGTARFAQSSTILPNGAVLAVGGNSGAAALASTEQYTPSAATWAALTSLNNARYAHSATLLLTGKVLVTGGQGAAAVLATTEIYDPANNTWTVSSSAGTGNLITARYGHTATELANGKVLVVGGQASGGGYLASAEIYDLLSGTWSSAGSLANARSGHTATLLANGKVLVSGGQNGGATALASAELYDPASNTWSSTGSLVAARTQHSATLLLDGRVLVAGGSSGAASLSSSELYTPSTASWSNAATLLVARSQHSAVLLPNGRVLIAGGYTAGTTATTTAEVYDPFALIGVGWVATSNSLSTARGQAGITLLPSGQVLISGGANAGAASLVSNLYDSGLGFVAGRRAVLTGVPGSAAPGGYIGLIGTKLTGDSEASSGGTNTSNSNSPVIQMRRVDNGYVQYVLPSQNVSYTDTSWISQLLSSNLPYGHYALTLLVDGVPSQSNLVSFVANLSNLTISSGSLSPNFDSGINSYTVSVPNTTSSITLTPTLATPNATVTVNGTTVSSGSASAAVALNVGANAIPVVITTLDGGSQTYTVTITRGSVLSTDASLSALSVNGVITTPPSTPVVAISPAFATATLSYTAVVANNIGSVTITPTATESHATLSVNGTPTASGTASAAITLTPGPNTITVDSVAQDGSTTQSYALVITQAAAGSNNALLSDLALSGGATLSPSLSASTASYSASVPFATSSMTITPTASDSNATITINGASVTTATASSAINLNVGTNTITVVVTAQNLVSTRTYTLTVTRAAGSSDTGLADLTLSGGVTLSPSPTTNASAFTASAPLATTSLTVTPTTTDANATITVNGVSVTTATASSSINLNIGVNTITVVVTAQDTTSTRTYTISVTRSAGSSNAGLAGLALSGGYPLSPAFSAGTTSYTASVPNATSSINITPTLADNTATVQVNGRATNSGAPSSAIVLSVGVNIINVLVTAQDGSTTQSYTLSISRADSTTGGSTVGSGTSANLTTQGTLSLASGSTLNVSSGTETVGSTLYLPVSGSVNLLLGSLNTLTATTTGSGGQLLLVTGLQGGNSQAVPLLVSGEVNISGQSGAALLAIGVINNAATTVTASPGGATLNAQLASDGSTLVSITSGSAIIPCTYLCVGSATSITLYTGDVATFDNLGGILRLASRGGGAGVPLNLGSLPANLSLSTFPVSLDGTPARLNGQRYDSLLLSAFNALQGTSYTRDGLSGVGALRLRSGNSTLFTVPVSDILFDPRITSSRVLNNDHRQIVAGGLMVELAPSLGDSSGFATLLARLDPAAQVNLTSGGKILVTLLGQRYLLLASWTSTATSFQGIGVDGANNLYYADAFGNRQTLYPAFANFELVRNILNNVDQQASVVQQSDGTVKVTLFGANYRFRPGYLLISTPAAHGGDPWWVEGATVFINNQDGTAQGFRIE